MAYRLSLDDEIAASVRRCALEELEGAATRLEHDRASDPVGAVHGARKSLKKTRALLRLVRSDIGERTYRRENQAMAEAGRAIAGTRDADVMVIALDGLAERYVGRLPDATFAELRGLLQEAAVAARAPASGAKPDAVAGTLRAIAGGVEGWPLERCDRSTLAQGAAAAYRRGRKERSRAARDPSTERLHEWRKRIKDLWYHHRLLEEAWPELMGAYATDLRALSERLGDDHDLALLAGRLTEPGGPLAAARAELEPVAELVADRRAELIGDAHRLAARLYAERPGAFADRVERYLGV